MINYLIVKTVDSNFPREYLQTFFYDEDAAVAAAQHGGGSIYEITLTKDINGRYKNDEFLVWGGHSSDITGGYRRGWVDGRDLTVKEKEKVRRMFKQMQKIIANIGE